MVKGCACSLGLIVLLLAGETFALEMVVSPRVLVLKAPGEVVTMHTDVPYSADLECELLVNDAPVAFVTFPDDCGDLVVQSSREAVKDLVGPTDAAVAFTLTVDGEAGTVSIPVKR